MLVIKKNHFKKFNKTKVKKEKNKYSVCVAQGGGGEDKGTAYT